MPDLLRMRPHARLHLSLTSFKPMFKCQLKWQVFDIFFKKGDYIIMYIVIIDYNNDSKSYECTVMTFLSLTTCLPVGLSETESTEPNYWIKHLFSLIPNATQKVLISFGVIYVLSLLM